MSPEKNDRLFALLFGAYVADAAALGLHWLYDPERLCQVAGEQPEFLTPSEANYAGAQGVFVHHGKPAGVLSQYGATLRLIVQSLAAKQGRLDIADYQQRFQAFYGPGGPYVGYIDKPTRMTLRHLAQEPPLQPSGADDTQIPALSVLPALVVADYADPNSIEQAVRVSHNNDYAVAVAQTVAELLARAAAGPSQRQTLLAMPSSAPPGVAKLFAAARDLQDLSLDEAAAKTGRACQLHQTVPLLLHIVADSESFTGAVRANIRAGGDSCGRAITLGALCGALYGIGGAQGIPYSWLLRLRDGAEMAYEISSLAKSLS